MTDKRPKKENGGGGNAEPSKPKKAGRPKGPTPSAKAKASAPKSVKPETRGRPPAYNWNEIRNSYVSGNQSVAKLREELLKRFRENEVPSVRTIEDRATAENWVELRGLFAERVRTQMQQTELAAAVEVRQRQARGAIRFQEVALEALELQFGPPPPELEGDEPDKEAARFEWKERQRRNLAELGPFALARLWSMGASEERKARGLDEMEVNLNDIQTPEDLRKLSLEQLLQLKAMRRKALGTDPSAATQSLTAAAQTGQEAAPEPDAGATAGAGDAEGQEGGGNA